MISIDKKTSLLRQRFRGYFPVVIDVETGGFNPQTDALLEIAAMTTSMSDDGYIQPASIRHFHIIPFSGANIEQSAIEFNGIDPHCALRGAVSEREALQQIFSMVRNEQKKSECQRSIVVAHNAAFDLSFLNAAIERTKIKRSPFHPFVSFDTTTLSGLILGQTVLVKACAQAGIQFNTKEAHSALYDTQKTTELFCHIVNKFKRLGGWPVDVDD